MPEQLLVGGVGRGVRFGKILVGVNVLRTMIFRVIGAELDEDVVAGLDGIEHFVPAAFLQEALEGFAGLGVVSDRDSGLEPAGRHLAPAAVARLVGDGGVAEDEEGDGVIHLLDLQGGERRMGVAEAEREPFIPAAGNGLVSREVHLPAVEVDLATGGNFRSANVDGEGAGDEFSSVSVEMFQHQTAGLGLDRDGGFGLRVAEGDRDTVVAFGHGNGKGKRVGRSDCGGLQRIGIVASDDRQIGARLKTVAGVLGVGGGGSNESVAGGRFAGAELELEGGGGGSGALGEEPGGTAGNGEQRGQGGTEDGV